MKCLSPASTFSFVIAPFSSPFNWLLKRTLIVCVPYHFSPSVTEIEHFCLCFDIRKKILKRKKDSFLKPMVIVDTHVRFTEGLKSETIPIHRTGANSKPYIKTCRKRYFWLYAFKWNYQNFLNAIDEVHQQQGLQSLGE